MARQKNKVCRSCQRSFRGRSDAQTCSEACRKRLQRLKKVEPAVLRDLEEIRSKIESSVGELEHKIVPIPVSEDGFIVTNAVANQSSPPPAAPQAPLPKAATSPEPLYSNLESLDSTYVQPNPMPAKDYAPTPNSLLIPKLHRYYARWIAATVILLIAGLGVLALQPNHKSDSTGKKPAGQINSASLGGSGQSGSNKGSVLNINYQTIIDNGQKLTATGPVVIQNTINSTGALNVQNASGNSVLVVDTANGRVGIDGQPTGPEALQVSGDVYASGQILAGGGISSLTSDNLAIGGSVVCTPAGCVGTAGSKGPKGDKGDTGAAGSNGANGANGTNGTNGSSGCSSGCVTLQATSPGVQETGNINISGTIIAGNILPNTAGSLTAGIDYNLLDGDSTDGSLGAMIIMGPDGFPRILSSDYSSNLSFIRCTDLACSSPVVTPIDPGIGGGYDAEAIAIGPDGFARLAFAAGNGDGLEYARCTDIDCTSPVITLVDSNPIAGYYGVSMAIAPADGFARIAYLGGSNNETDYLACNDADCTAPTTQVIGGNDYGYAVTALALGADGFARIVYEDSDGTLKLARCTDIACSAPVITGIDSLNTNGPGYWGVAIQMGPDDFPRIAFIDNSANKYLSFAQCGDADCTSPSISQLEATDTPYSGFGFALDGNGLAHFSYDNFSNTDLNVDNCNDASCSSHTSVLVDANRPNTAQLANSMALSAGGLPSIVYADGSSSGGLRYANFLSSSGAGAATGVSLGNSSTQYAEVHAIALYQDGNQVCDVSNNCGSINNGGNSLGSAISIGTNDDFGVNIVTDGATVASLSDTGQAIFQNSSDSTDAFQVEDGSGVPILTVDTVNDEVLQNGWQVCDMSGNCGGGSGDLQAAYDASTSPATITTSSSSKNVVLRAGYGDDSTGIFQVQNSSGVNLLNVDTQDSNVALGTQGAINGSLVFNTTDGSGTAITILAADTGSSYSITLPTVGPATDQCLITGSVTASLLQFGTCETGSGTNAIGTIDTQTPTSDGAVISGTTLYMQSASASDPGLVNTGTQTFAGDKTLTGNTTLSGDVLAQDSSNSTTAFQVQDSGGGSLLTVDALHHWVGINNVAPAATLDVVAAGPIFYDGFESGLMAPFITFGGSWAVSSGYGHTGSYGLQSNGNSCNGSGVSVTETSTNPGTVSFWANWNSPYYYLDNTEFFIDGVYTGTVAQNAGWGEYSYSVGAGTHTYSWVLDYYAGGSCSGWDAPDFRLDDVSITNVGAGAAALFNGGAVGIGTTNPGATLETDGTALFKAATDSTTLFQIQNSSSAPLFVADTSGMQITISGSLAVNGHIITGNKSGTTTVAAGAAATCTSGSPSVNISGNDTSGKVTITTASTCSAGTLATITFANAYASAPRVTLTPADASGAGQQYYNGTTGTGSFTIDTASTPGDTTTYIYNYHVFQ